MRKISGVGQTPRNGALKVVALGLPVVFSVTGVGVGLALLAVEVSLAAALIGAALYLGAVSFGIARYVTVKQKRRLIGSERTQ